MLQFPFSGVIDRIRIIAVTNKRAWDFNIQFLKFQIGNQNNDGKSNLNALPQTLGIDLG